MPHSRTVPQPPSSSPLMTNNSPTQFGTDAWLLRGIRSLPGTLQLARRCLSFTAFDAGNFRPRQLRALEQDFGRPGLVETLTAGKTAVVFELPLSAVQAVRFPWYYFSGGLHLTLNGVRYRFGFDEPSNTKGAGEGGDLLGSAVRARRRGKAWKAVFTGLCSPQSE